MIATEKNQAPPIHTGMNIKKIIHDRLEVEKNPEPAPVKAPETPQMTAKEKIDLIEEAETVEAVNALLDGDERKTVIEAGADRIAELQAGE